MTIARIAIQITDAPRLPMYNGAIITFEAPTDNPSDMHVISVTDAAGNTLPEPSKADIALFAAAVLSGGNSSISFRYKGRVIDTSAGMPDSASPAPSPDVPSPGTGQTPASWPDLNKPLLFIGAPTYFWHAQKDIAGTVRDICRIPGSAGPSCEVGARMNIPGQVVKDVEGHYAGLLPYFKIVLDTARAEKRYVHEEFTNSNSKGIQAASDATLKAIAKARNALGFEASIVNPVNERDGAFKRVSSITGTLAVPADRLIDPVKRPAKGWLEKHPSKISAIAGYGKLGLGCRLIVASDNGGILGEIYGGNWKDAPAVKRDKLLAFVQACHDIGASCVIYSFEQSLNLPLLREAAAIYAGTAAPQPAGGFVVKADGDRYIKWAKLPWKNAPGKGVCGWIIVNGVRVEQFREGYTRQHLKNAYGKGEHGVRGIKTGDMVQIEFTQQGGNGHVVADPFKWPWAPT